MTEAGAAQTRGEMTEAEAAQTNSEMAEAEAAQTKGEMTEAEAAQTNSEMAEAEAAQTKGEMTEAEAAQTKGEMTEAEAAQTNSELIVAGSAQTNREMTVAGAAQTNREMSMAGSAQNKRSWKKFFVHLAGETLGAHKGVVSKFQSIGQSEVTSPEESDYILLFCPIVSCVGTDISEALEKTPGGKKIILIVMHHTFNPSYITADSKGLVENRDVLLVVDCLFYKGRLLKSNSNDRAWAEIKRFFGDPKEVSNWECIII